MGEPEKPFACTLPDCGMTFTNEDHLHVHTKKHDMVLQLGSEQKAAFVADQTPTPTRFIRNCEEVGLFQDLQNVNVNPFDEGFKRAMEAKPGILSLEGAVVTSSDDVLHTPQMVFPLIDHGDSTLYSTTNNQRNITISRSSSDESGAVKEYETTTISKLTNEVTTISRIVGKQDILDKITTTDDVSIVKHQELAQNKDLVNETSVSYTNNVIKFHSNVEIRKDGSIVNIETTKPVTLISYKDSVIKDATSVVTKDVLLTDSNRLQIPEIKIPIMSQRSIDLVVDNLTAECENQIQQKDDKTVKVVDNHNTFNRNKFKKANKSINKEVVRNILKKDKTTGKKQELTEDYEVIIKLPNGKHVRMKAVDDKANEKSKVVEDETKEKLKKVLAEKVDKKSLDNPTLLRVSSLDGSSKISNIVPVTARLYPVTILSPSSPILLTNAITKMPIPPLSHGKYTKSSETIKKNVKVKATKDKNNPVRNDITIETIDKSKCNVNTHITNNTNVKDNSKNVNGYDSDCVISEVFDKYNGVSKTSIQQNLEKKFDDPVIPPNFSERRCAASKRYRERLKVKMQHQSETIKKLKELNEYLMAENSSLKNSINNHLRKCSNPDDFKERQDTVLKK